MIKVVKGYGKIGQGDDGDGNCVRFMVIGDGCDKEMDILSTGWIGTLVNNVSQARSDILSLCPDVLEWEMK